MFSVLFFHMHNCKDSIFFNHKLVGNMCFDLSEMNEARLNKKSGNFA